MIVLHRFFLPSRSIIKRYLNSVHLTTLLIALALLAPAIQAAQPDNHIDTADFYQGEALHHPQLSPDGTHLAVLQDVGNDTIILVRNLITGESFYPIKSDNERFKFNWISWGNNDRLLMSVRFSNNRGMRILFTETRLLAIDAKKPSEVTTLIRPDAKADGWISQFQDNIIHWLPDDPEHVLISVDRESPAKQSVYKLNIYNGKTQRVKKFNAGIRSWLADQQGEVRVLATTIPNAKPLFVCFRPAAKNGKPHGAIPYLKIPPLPRLALATTPMNSIYWQTTKAVKLFSNRIYPKKVFRWSW